MNWIDCYEWPMKKSYYITHPHKWVKELFINMKNARMRVKKGYCYPDVWNFNTWFTTIAPHMLRYMADHGDAYPGVEPFETPDKWHHWLHVMADKLEDINQDFACDIITEQNEYNEAMEEALKKAQERWKKNHPDEELTVGQEFTPEEEEIRKKYWARNEELANERQRNVEDVFSELGKYWEFIWD